MLCCAVGIACWLAVVRCVKAGGVLRQHVGLEWC